MAATRLIAMHVQKHECLMESLKGRLDYAKNGLKTADGEYVTSYECDPRTVDREFLLAKSQYEIITGRTWKNDIIAYQIRQSFKPGEITPEEANRLGYETAMRWTKGKHAFIVATHIDKNHIHNHVIYNSTTLDCTHKYNYFHLCGLALQRLSDTICLENGYSVIEKKSYKEQDKKSRYHRVSARMQVRDEIKRLILEKNPKDLEDLLRLLEEQEYIIKRGKHIAIKKENQKRFIRLSSLGDGYEEGDFEKILEKYTGKADSSVDLGALSDAENLKKPNGTDVGRKYNQCKDKIKNATPKSKRIESIIDIQELIAAGRGVGYERWAKLHNVKQIAESLVLMKELGIETISELSEKADKISSKSAELLDIIKTSEARLKEISELKMNIINYSKTREAYVAYRKGGYKKEFFEANREALSLHKATKDAFGKLDGKIPTLKELNAEYREVLKKKKVAEVEYYPMKKQNRDLQMAKYNMERFRNQTENEQQTQEKQNKKDEQSL